MKKNRFLTVILCMLFALNIMMPAAVYAEEPEQKVVRVGWFDSSFDYYDQFGRRCGVDYEY